MYLLSTHLCYFGYSIVRFRESVPLLDVFFPAWPFNKSSFNSAPKGEEKSIRCTRRCNCSMSRKAACLGIIKDVGNDRQESHRKGAEKENHRLKSALFGVGYVSFREGKALKGFFWVFLPPSFVGNLKSCCFFGGRWEKRCETSCLKKHMDRG